MVTSTATIDIGIFCTPAETGYKWQFMARKDGSGSPAFTLMTDGAKIMFFNVTTEHVDFLGRMLKAVRDQLFPEAAPTQLPKPPSIREVCRRAHGMIHLRLEGMSMGKIAEIEEVERLLMEIVEPQGLVDKT